MCENMTGFEKMKLTTLAACAGCSAKADQNDLADVLRSLPLFDSADVLQGFATADDAGVFRLNDELAIVQTVDFFPPIVDDAYDYGAIAAANSLSDIYAMGARPASALSVLGYPAKKMPRDVVAEILRGAFETARSAECPVIGGHTINAPEPFFGLAVTGTVHPDKFIKNGGGKAGDLLVLTKPIGTGIATTAARAGLASVELMAAAVGTMKKLNKEASEAMSAAGVSACTDVTGFGLLGHLHEICLASGVGALVRYRDVPLIGGEILGLVAEGMATKLTNYYNAAGYAVFADEIGENERIVLCDPQTSGGLLMAMSPDAARVFMEEFARKGGSAALIGEIADDPEMRIKVV